MIILSLQIIKNDIESTYKRLIDNFDNLDILLLEDIIDFP